MNPYFCPAGLSMSGTTWDRDVPPGDGGGSPPARPSAGLRPGGGDGALLPEGWRPALALYTRVLAGGGDPEEAHDAAFGLRFEPRTAWEGHLRSAILGAGD